LNEKKHGALISAMVVVKSSNELTAAEASSGEEPTEEHKITNEDSSGGRQ